MLFYLIFSMLAKVISILRLILIVQFLFSMALAFNLISIRNNTVRTMWQGLYALTEPVLGPIRRALPNYGPIDFSPMIVLMVMSLLTEVFRSIAMLGL